MTTVSRTFTVDPAPPVVVPYWADFGNAERWDPDSEKCKRIDSGPVQVGASWRNTSKVGGSCTELIYALQELTAGRVVLVGENDTATSTETIEVSPERAGSSATYTNELEFYGASRLAAPLGKLVIEKLGNDTQKQLTDALDGLQS